MIKDTRESFLSNVLNGTDPNYYNFVASVQEALHSAMSCPHWPEYTLSIVQYV